eukprot:g2371.t1
MDSEQAQRLITEKEKEINELRQESIRNLELQLRSSSKALEEARVKERDLIHQEEDSRTKLQASEEELNKSRKEVQGLLEIVQRSEQAFKELENRYQNTLKELEGWMTRSNREKEASVDRQRQQQNLLRKELEKEKETELQEKTKEWKIERTAFKVALQDAEKEMKNQKHELKAVFDSERKKLHSRIDQAYTELGVQQAKQEELQKKLELEQKALRDSKEQETSNFKTEIEKLKEETEKLSHEKQSLQRECENQRTTAKRLEDELAQKIHDIVKQTESMQQLKYTINELSTEFQNREVTYEQQMTSIREEAKYQVTLLSEKHNKERQAHQEFVVRLEREREELSSELGSLRAASQVEFSRLKELHTQEILEMENKFEESADQRTTALKSVREHLLTKDKELMLLDRKVTTLKQSIEDRDSTIHKFKSCLKAMQLRYGDMEAALKSKVCQISSLEGKLRSQQKETQITNASLENKEQEIKDLHKKLDDNNTQIERLKDIVKNLINEKQDLIQDKQTKKLGAKKEDRGMNTDVVHQYAAPPSEICEEIIPEFSLPSDDDSVVHSHKGRILKFTYFHQVKLLETDDLELLQKENCRLGNIVKVMTEELKQIKQTVHQRKVPFVDKEVQTEASDLMTALRSVQHELKEVEKELKASYEHIQVLEQRDAAETNAIEINYLREQVRNLRQEYLCLRRRQEQAANTSIKPQRINSEKCRCEEFVKEINFLKSTQEQNRQQ